MDKVKEYLDMPVDKLPRKEVREILGKFGMVFKQIEYGAASEYCDWQIPLRKEGYGVIMPSLGKYRNIAKAMALQARLEIAEGRFDDAITTMKNALALSRHLAESPIIISALVGMGTGRLMINQIEQSSREKWLFDYRHSNCII